MKKLYLVAIIFALAGMSLSAQVKHRVIYDAGHQQVYPYSQELVKLVTSPIPFDDKGIAQPAFVNFEGGLDASRFYAKPTNDDKIQAKVRGSIKAHFTDPTGDDNDSSVAYPAVSKRNSEGVYVFAPIFSFPYNLNEQYGFHKSWAQGFPPLNGTFDVDSVVFYMFVPTGLSATDNEYLFLPWRSGRRLGDTTDFKGIRMAVDDVPDSLLLLEDGYASIPTDQVNNAVSQGQINPIVLDFTAKPMHVPANYSQIYMCLPLGSPIDSFRILAVYEWNLHPYQTFGMFIRDKDGADTLESSWIWSRTWQPPYDTYLAGLHGQPTKQNYQIWAMGMYEESGTPVEVDEASALDASNYPNPAASSTTIKYSIPSEGNVQIELFDAAGKSYGSLVNQFHNAGTFTVELTTGLMTPGAYYYNINFNGKTVTRSLNVVR